MNPGSCPDSSLPDPIYPAAPIENQPNATEPPGGTGGVSDLDPILHETPTETPRRLPPYRPFIRRTSAFAKIPGADPSQITPGYERRLALLVAALEGGNGCASRGGAGGSGSCDPRGCHHDPLQAPSRRLASVYVRPGCVELLMEEEEWGSGSWAQEVEAAPSPSGPQAPCPHLSQPQQQRDGGFVTEGYVVCARCQSRATAARPGEEDDGDEDGSGWFDFRPFDSRVAGLPPTQPAVANAPGIPAAVRGVAVAVTASAAETSAEVGWAGATGPSAAFSLRSAADDFQKSEHWLPEGRSSVSSGDRSSGPSSGAGRRVSGGSIASLDLAAIIRALQLRGDGGAAEGAAGELGLSGGSGWLEKEEGGSERLRAAGCEGEPAVGDAGACGTAEAEAGAGKDFAGGKEDEAPHPGHENQGQLLEDMRASATIAGSTGAAGAGARTHHVPRAPQVPRGTPQRGGAAQLLAPVLFGQTGVCVALLQPRVLLLPPGGSGQQPSDNTPEHGAQQPETPLSPRGAQQQAVQNGGPGARPQHSAAEDQTRAQLRRGSAVDLWRPWNALNQEQTAGVHESAWQQQHHQEQPGSRGHGQLAQWERSLQPGPERATGEQASGLVATQGRDPVHHQQSPPPLRSRQQQQRERALSSGGLAPHTPQPQRPIVEGPEAAGGSLRTCPSTSDDRPQDTAAQSTRPLPAQHHSATSSPLDGLVDSTVTIPSGSTFEGPSGSTCPVDGPAGPTFEGPFQLTTRASSGSSQPVRGSGRPRRTALLGAVLSCASTAPLADGELEVLLRSHGRYLPVRVQWLGPDTIEDEEDEEAPAAAEESREAAAGEGDRVAAQAMLIRARAVAAAVGGARRGAGGRREGRTSDAEAGLDVNRLHRLELELLELPHLPGIALVDFRWRGRPCRAVPLVLTSDPGVASELQAAVAAWSRPQSELDELLLDFGTWEFHATRAATEAAATGTPAAAAGSVRAGAGYGGAAGRAGGPSGGRVSLDPVSSTRLRELTLHLLRYVEACDWAHTAMYVRAMLLRLENAAAAGAGARDGVGGVGAGPSSGALPEVPRREDPWVAASRPGGAPSKVSAQQGGPPAPNRELGLGGSEADAGAGTAAADGIVAGEATETGRIEGEGGTGAAGLGDEQWGAAGARRHGGAREPGTAGCSADGLTEAPALGPLGDGGRMEGTDAAVGSDSRGDAPTCSGMQQEMEKEEGKGKGRLSRRRHQRRQQQQQQEESQGRQGLRQWVPRVALPALGFRRLPAAEAEAYGRFEDACMAHHSWIMPFLDLACALVLLARRRTQMDAMASATILVACGPGAAVAVARAMLSYDKWMQLVRATRVPRFLFYAAAKCLIAVGAVRPPPEIAHNVAGQSMLLLEGVVLPAASLLAPLAAAVLLPLLGFLTACMLLACGAVTDPWVATWIATRTAVLGLFVTVICRACVRGRFLAAASCGPGPGCPSQSS